MTRPNTLIAIDEVEFKRTEIAVLPEAQKAQQDLIRDVLSWEPLGHAQMINGTIELPRTGGKELSGIALPIKEETSGVDFVVRGTGDVLISLGDPATGSKEGGSIPIPANATLYFSVRTQENGLTIGYAETENGAQTTNILANLKAPAKFIIIEASESAVIPKTPKIIRR